MNKAGMMKAFKELGKDALSMNHYELEQSSLAPFSADDWKEFLADREVQKYIKTEMDIIKTSQMNKIVQEAGDSRSVGQAQLLNTLAKLDDNEIKKEGPVFIYTYVPLTEDEEKAAEAIANNEA